MKTLLMEILCRTNLFLLDALWFLGDFSLLGAVHPQISASVDVIAAGCLRDSLFDLPPHRLSSVLFPLCFQVASWTKTLRDGSLSSP